MEPNSYTGPERRKQHIPVPIDRRKRRRRNIPVRVERRAGPVTNDAVRRIIDERRDSDPVKSHTIRNPRKR
jgi:hypothetical protein